MTGKIIKRCVRPWRRIGVSGPAITDMAAELEADLSAAAADGRDPEAYVGGDPSGFARAWASARGEVPLRPRIARVTAAAVLGALPGGLAGLFMAFGLSSEGLAQVLDQDADRLDVPPDVLILLYALSAFIAWLGLLAATSAVLRFHADAARQPAVRTLAWTTPAAGIFAAAVTVAAARLKDYPYGPRYVAAEMIAPVAILAITIALTRLRVIRRLRPTPVPPTESLPVPTWTGDADER